MPTPSTRTPVRIARGSYSNLNSSISDLGDGEIVYAEDQDKLYVKEGSSLVALTQPAASPTFTGDVTFTGASSNGIWDASANAFVANVTGNCSGTAATVTGAAQSNITSVGTLTGLTVAGNYAQTLSANGGFTATAAGNHAIQIIGDANRSADQNTLLSLHGKWNGTNVATIDIQAGADTTNKDNGQIVFYTAAAGSATEALRIHENQSAVFTGTVEVSKSGGSDAAYMTIVGGEGNVAAIYLISDEGDDNGDYWYISASPGDNNLYFQNKTSGSYATKAQVTEEGEVHDANGDLRAIPENATTSAYTLVAADRGKCVTNTTGGVTIPYNTFATGDVVTIINHSGSNITITSGANLTLYNSADAATGNRTLAARGMATVWFEAQNLAYISGAGLS